MPKFQNSDEPSDEISVWTSPFGQRIELRIGWEERGVTRVAKLKISEARKIGEELIRQADELAKRNLEKKKHADEVQALKESGDWPL